MKIDLFIFFLILILVNFLLAFHFEKYSHLFKIVDKPDKIRKLHKNDTKVLGGTIILLNIFIFFLYFLFIDQNFITNVFGEIKNANIFFFSILLIYLVGICDDVLNIPAINKTILIVLILSSSLYLNKNLITELNISFFETIYLHKFSIFFTIFCYLVFMNAFNMLDGVNLQIGLYSLFIIFFLLFKELDIFFALTIIFGILTYLKLNFENKIFLGDNGSLLLSFIFSYFFINLYNENKIVFSDEIFVVLIVPGLEVVRLSIKRIINNKSILKPDRNHIHHLILSKKNYYWSIIFIQLVFILPYLASIIVKNNLYVITSSILIYTLIIFYFSKK